VKEQARLLLSAYRPDGRDASDPAFAEALALAQRDPQLRSWLEESQHFDRAISERLRSLDVPADLRETILAGARLSRAPRWWQSRRLWSIAATIAVLGLAGSLLWPRAVKLADWQIDSLAAIEAVQHGAAKLDVENADPALLLEWLRTRHMPHPAAEPSMLAGRKTFGCKAIDAHGRTISVICFQVNSGEVAHLFTTPRAGLELTPPENHPVFKRHRNWNLASWSSGAQAHMLASTMDEEKFRHLVLNYVAVQIVQRAAMFAVLEDW
jgi:hypothetical protein